MVTPIELLWESDSAIAINKPAGLATQSPQAFESVESRLREQLDRIDRYLAFPHRLDRCVSGVLLVALTKRSAGLLSGQFATRKTVKRYQAVVEGVLERGGRWENFVRKLAGQPQVEVCGEHQAGAKLATTDVSILDSDSAGRQTRLQLQPRTGRMHQLRVQTSHRGFPIVGDVLYGAQHEAEARSAGDGTDQAKTSTGTSAESISLHAESLRFHHPKSGVIVEVQAKCPF